MDMDGGNDYLKYAGVAVAALIVGAAGMFLMQNPEAVTGGPGQQEPTGNFSDYAGAGEATGTTQASEASVAATVKIGEFGVTPARASIQVGQAVQWKNNNAFPVRLEFDRTPQTPTIQPNGTLEMKFRGITYYTVYNANTDKEIAQGSINVQ
ncbi:MAG: hypothetical protein ABEJ62_00875 [Candidatus Nanohaloarchaea archaeon]